MLSSTASTLRRWASFTSKAPEAPENGVNSSAPTRLMARAEPALQEDDGPDSEPPAAQRGTALPYGRKP